MKANEMVQIEIDRETFEALQALAEPLIDTPQTVVRRLAGLPPLATKGRGPVESASSRAGRPRKGKRRSTRAAVGSLLPEQEYELPILRYLQKNGGQAASRDVVAAVGRELSDKLTRADRERLDTGGIRWETRVHFTRLRLAERGLLRRDTARGIWALTDAGVEVAKNGTGSAG